MAPLGFHLVITITFDRQHVIPLYITNKPHMINPLFALSVEPENIRRPDRFERFRTLTSTTPAIGFRVRKQGRAPRVPRFGQTRLTITKRNKSRTPGISFAQSGVSQVSFHPFPIVPAR